MALMEGPGWRVERGDDVKGRRVVATRAFQPGEVILRDDAYAWALLGDQADAYCDCCLRPAAEARRCSACKLSCYAGKEHQARAWRAGHKEECSALRACAPRVPPTAVRLAVRCLLRHARARRQAAAGGGSVAPADRFGQVLGLEDHWAALPDGQKLEYAQMGALAHRLLAAASPELADAGGAADAGGSAGAGGAGGSGGGDVGGSSDGGAVTPRYLALLLARFGSSSHTISDDELRPVAVAVFPLGAMVNHDCRPSAVHAFEGPRIVFRAVRPIAPGEEVTTAYTELGATRWERRRELLRHHVFDIDAPAAAAGSSGGPAGAGSSSAAAAAAAAAAAPAAAPDLAAAEAALQCAAAQQPAAVLPLPSSGAELRLYDCTLPPWPHDERDAELTAVVSEPGGSSSRDSEPIGAVGMWGRLAPAHVPAAAPAGASFEVADDEDATSVGSAVAAAAAAEQQQQQQQATAIHCWGPGLSAPSPQLLALAEQYVAALRLQQRLDGLLASGQAVQAAAQLRSALRALCEAPHGGRGLALGPRHVLRMRLLSDLQRAAVAAQEWEAALQAARELLPLYQAVYPPVWPQTGLLWAGVAKLEHLLVRPAQALAAAQAALRCLVATHGGGGAAAGAMRRMAWEAEQELAHGQQQHLAAGEDDD